MEIKEYVKSLRDFVRTELPREYAFELIPGMFGVGTGVTGMYSTDYDGVQLVIKKNMTYGFELRLSFPIHIGWKPKEYKTVIKDNIKGFIEYATHIKSFGETTKSEGVQSSGCSCNCGCKTEGIGEPES